MEQINYSKPNNTQNNKIKKRNGGTFRYFYFVYLCVAIVFGLCSIFHVRGLLAEYEASQPERIVESEIDALIAAAKDGTALQKYSFPDAEPGELEEGLDLSARRIDELKEGGVTYSLDPVAHEEKTRVYSVLSSSGEAIAKITLQEVGEPVTKLAVFTIQNWEKADTSFVADKTDYIVNAPDGFTVEVNGKALTDEYAYAATGMTSYKLEGLYLYPTIVIRDSAGNIAEYKKVGNTFRTIYFDYSLTLPSSITVTVNGEEHIGYGNSEGLIKHDIKTLSEPDVKLSDLWGNTVDYDGGNSLDITYLSLTALSSYKVTVDGADVPESAYTEGDNPEYDSFYEYDSTLPRLRYYDIAVLKNDADIVITSPDGSVVDYDKTSHTLSLTLLPDGNSLPEDISSQVDVLKIAEDWSLMMSADLYGNLYGFYNYASNLIEGSQLYKVAYNWVTSIDITFTSYHTLENPPFTDEVVANYRRLSDNTFTVDISFTKNMNITGSGYHADKMNSRFTFVKYNSAWKLVNIKEIVE